MDPQDIVEVYRAKNNLQAELFLQELEAAGIRATVENSLLTGGAAEVIGWAADPRIMVDAKDEKAARTIIAQSEHLEAVGQQTRDADGDTATCLSCGAGLPAGVAKCPVCGWSYAASEPVGDL